MVQQGELLVGLIGPGGKPLVLGPLPLDRLHNVQPDPVDPVSYTHLDVYKRQRE